MDKHPTFQLCHTVNVAESRLEFLVVAEKIYFQSSATEEPIIIFNCTLKIVSKLPSQNAADISILQRHLQTLNEIIDWVESVGVARKALFGETHRLSLSDYCSLTDCVRAAEKKLQEFLQTISKGSYTSPYIHPGVILKPELAQTISLAAPTQR